MNNINSKRDKNNQSNQKLPKPEKQLPKPEKDLPLPEKDLPLPEKDLPLPEKDLPLPEKEIPAHILHTQFRRKYHTGRWLVFFLISSLLIIGICYFLIFHKEAKSPVKQTNKNLKEVCAYYTNNGKAITACATCGNGICEPYETCTPSAINKDIATADCGSLYCEQDCKRPN